MVLLDGDGINSRRREVERPVVERTVARRVLLEVAVRDRLRRSNRDELVEQPAAAGDLVLRYFRLVEVRTGNIDDWTVSREAEVSIPPIQLDFAHIERPNRVRRRDLDGGRGFGTHVPLAESQIRNRPTRCNQREDLVDAASRNVRDGDVLEEVTVKIERDSTDIIQRDAIRVQDFRVEGVNNAPADFRESSSVDGQLRRHLRIDSVPVDALPPPAINNYMVDVDRTVDDTVLCGIRDVAV